MFKTCSQNERGNKLSYQSPPPRLQGMGKNPNVSHAQAITPTKQKSENISRRYTYGMGTPSLGRCPVANKLTAQSIRYDTLSGRPTTNTEPHPPTPPTLLTKIRIPLAKVSIATGRLPCIHVVDKCVYLCLCWFGVVYLFGWWGYCLVIYVKNILFWLDIGDTVRYSGICKG